MNIVNKKIKILDCTLRDGGYYNNWNFNTNLVQKYLKSISESKIEAVELGYRIIDKKKLFGKYAYIDENLVKNLKTENKIDKFVMINSSEFFIKNKFLSNLISKNFVIKDNSFIDGFRIATNIKEYKRCKKLTKELSKLGYKICLNLMQASNKSNQYYKEISQDINSWKNVDVLYFADSFGNMLPDEVYNVTKIFKKF